MTAAKPKSALAELRKAVKIGNRAASEVMANPDLVVSPEHRAALLDLIEQLRADAEAL